MKGKILFFAGLVLGLVACSDSAAVRGVTGAYRFKTTGSVVLEEHYAGATVADTLVAALENETGVVEVVSLHDGDSVLLTIDPLNGSVAVSRGKIADGRIDFVSYKRTIEVPTTTTVYDTISVLSFDTVIVREKKLFEPFDITVSGYAEVYDNNLVFRLDYKGQSQSSERTLRSVEVTSLAKKN